MTNEQKFFLAILRDYIAEQKTIVPDAVDWNSIIRYAQTHQLQGIVYYQCQAFFNKHPDCNAYYSRLKVAYFRSIYFTEMRKQLLDQVKSEFNAIGLPFFIIKGERVARFYPHFEFRTMSDTDIVLNDREKAHEILLSLGFENLSHFSDREWIYCNNGIEIELHNRLVYDEAINDDNITRFLNAYDDYVVDGELDNSFHFIFVLCHLRKHFMNAGIGFRQFVDVAMLMKNDSSLRWDWIEEKLSEMNALAFAKTVFTYIQRWFGIIAPIEGVELEESVYDASTEYIFCNGVFGFNNAENKDYLSANEVRKSKFKGIVMLKNALRSIFPSYQSLCAFDQYAFLRGKPLLLPIAWLKRFGRAIKNKKMGVGKEMIQKAFVSKKYIDKREAMFMQWGIQ